MLTLLKESYLLLCNLYGLAVHPFQTIVRIRGKPDWSQTILVLGLPVWGGVGILGLLGMALILVLLFWPTNKILVNLLFFFLLCCLFFVVCAFSYIGFWVGKYLLYKKYLKKASRLAGYR